MIELLVYVIAATIIPMERTMAKRKYKIALIQMQCFKDKAKSLKKATDMIEKAVKKGAEVICLPELFLTDYFCQTENPALFDLAEPIPGPTTKALAALAKKHKVIIIGSIFEKRTAGIYHNTAIVLEKDGSLAGIYRKMHIPHDPNFYEKYYFTPGDLGYKSFETTAGNIGTLVCWDQWYPEAARLTALKGAEVIFYPTAIGWQPEDTENGTMLKESDFVAQLDSWITIQKSHAVANGVYVGAVNRIGREGEIVFWGNSFIADPFGKIIVQASSNKEEILVADVELDLVEQKRKYWPFFRDRRIDSYGEITQRFGK